VLGSAFLEDDTFNSYVDGWMGYEHLSFWHAVSLMSGASNTGNGRFYPVFPLLMVGEFHLVHSVALMKALVVAAILLNALTFWLLLRRIVPSLATPALVLLPAVLQIRFYHDPIVGFSLHMQLALEFALLHTGLFRRPAYWLSMVIVLGFQVPVDGWLTKRSAPIVIYNERQTSGVRFPFDIPIEDFLFGFALVTAVLLLWERQRASR